MQNDSTEYTSMTLIDSETDSPKVRITLSSGDEMILDATAVHKMAHAMQDWSFLIDDLACDRIHVQRNEGEGI